jgi:hypothetical protein
VEPLLRLEGEDQLTPASWEDVLFAVSDKVSRMWGLGFVGAVCAGMWGLGFVGAVRAGVWGLGFVGAVRVGIWGSPHVFVL